MVCAETQTTLGVLEQDPLVVNFLDGFDSDDDDGNLPICFHFGNRNKFASPLGFL